MLLDEVPPGRVALVAKAKSSRWMKGTARPSGFSRCQASMLERSSSICASLSSSAE